MSAKRKAIVVAGMHRSGTSALTRVVNLLGADLAHHLIPAGIGNELGHWESRAAQDVHNEMLAELQSDIYSPVNFPDAWFDSAAAKIWIDRIEALVRQEYSASDLFVLKDPRLSLFVPLWVAAFGRLGIDPRFVIPFRSPMAVAASLEVREHHLRSGHVLPLGQGVAVWLRYMLAAERHTRGQRRSFVSFDRLLADWRGEMARIGQQLDISWPRAGAADLDIDRFLDSDHRDIVSVASADGRVRISNLVSGVHEDLEQAVGDPEARSVSFDAAARTIAAAEELFGAYALVKESELAKLRQELAGAHRLFDREIRARDSMITEATAYARSLEQSRDEALRYARAQETRANELDRVLGTSRQ